MPWRIWYRMDYVQLCWQVEPYHQSIHSELKCKCKINKLEFVHMSSKSLNIVYLPLFVFLSPFGVSLICFWICQVTLGTNQLLFNYLIIIFQSSTLTIHMHGQWKWIQIFTCCNFLCLLIFSCSSFPIQLENPHVIERHQMMVGVVTKAPDGATLNSSYETRYAFDTDKDESFIPVTILLLCGGQDHQ